MSYPPPPNNYQNADYGGYPAPAPGAGAGGFQPMPGMNAPQPGGYPSPNYPPPPGAPGGPPSNSPGYAPTPSYGAPPGPPPSGYGAPTGPSPSGYYAPPPGAPQAPYMPPPGSAPSGYAPPTGPPPGGQYQPPPGQYQPPPGQYQPPPGQYQPPPGQYQPPPGQYMPPGGSLMPQQHMPPQHGMPPQQGGMPPQQGGVQYFLGVPIAGQPMNYDPKANIEKIRKATKGFGTDETALINVISPLDAMQVDELRKKFQAETGKGLIQVLEKETGSYFCMGLTGIIHGPLGWDADLAREAVFGAGTKETLLNEILLGRTNEEMELLKREYQKRFNRSLERDVKGDLSMKTERLFTMVLAAQRTHDSAPVDQNLVMADVETLYKAGPGKIGTDEIEICKILTNRSTPHMHAIISVYHQKYKQTLTKMIKKEFSGHMKEALLYIVEGAKKNDGGAHRDAKYLEKAMAGMGTKDEQLVYRLVRAHWNRARFEGVKAAYQTKYKKSLASRVKGETSGDYRKLMLAIIG